MKKSSAVVSLLLILGLVYYSFYSLMPQSGTPLDLDETQFSTERALVHLKEIAAEPHYVGSDAHTKVRQYIISQLEAMGIETQVQEGFDLDTRRGALVKPKNILARIKGSGEGKALLLLSHYDSDPSSSHGASDAGSGVVTILESLRAYMATNAKPVNDIIICITDSEELGLDGATLFVNEHPWAEDVGLVLNFEARGSGGPSNMIVETNGGNKNLIEAFGEADVKYPVASSLMYSIYKMLPNDTDSTVFREDGDIDSFFFAFIDDHYDYHTVNDNYENLDRNTLQHQGSYLLPLLTHFADADLTNLKSEVDYVYVNLPLVRFVSYPFSWILPMFLLACVVFGFLLFYGKKQKMLTGIGIIRGGLPFVLSLLLCGLLGYFGWELLLQMYPQYGEIQHGFTYNGHYYIIGFVMLCLGLTFLMYQRFAKEISAQDLWVIPMIVWLLINVGIYLKLQGAAYFVIPLFFQLIAFWYLLKYKKPNLIFLTLLAAPAIFVFAPLIQFFPVGLGLEMLVASCVVTVLLFGLLTTIFGNYQIKKALGYLSFFFAFIFLLTAHLKSSWSEDRPKPNSLMYYQYGTDAYWITYDDILDDWTTQYLGEAPEAAAKYINSSAGSKYQTGYSYANPTDYKQIKTAKIRIENDSTATDSLQYTFTIVPERRVNRLQLYGDSTLVFKELAFNGKAVPADSTGLVWEQRRSKFLMSYHISDRDSLEVKMTLANDVVPSFSVLEYSYDLMSHPSFSVAERPADMIPKPFVTQNAILTKMDFDLSEIKLEAVDSTQVD
ncbi:MAG: M28 family peptidase [Gilvibacter sp.]